MTPPEKTVFQLIGSANFREAYFAHAGAGFTLSEQVSLH
jgi:hypothetical protein